MAEMMAQMMCGAWGSWWALMMGLAGLLWLLVLIAIVAAVVWLVRAGSSRGEGARLLPGRPATDAPLDILRRRYAAGELSRDEFDRMKRELAEP